MIQRHNAEKGTTIHYCDICRKREAVIYIPGTTFCDACLARIAADKTQNAFFSDLMGVAKDIQPDEMIHDLLLSKVRF